MSQDPGAVPMREPLAFFLTWTTYGSWLPGDERGWVDKPGRIHVADAKRRQAARESMTEAECILDTDQRSIVEKTVADHCSIRDWHLHVVNCRTQHVHVVVTAPNREPEDVMNQFKAWCTRRLKEHLASKPEAQAKNTTSLSKPESQAKRTTSLSKPEAQAKETDRQATPNIHENWWTQRGSKRRLYDETSLEAAIKYVLEGQGGPPMGLE